MSAQAYTNRRRILAEVGVPKVQYKKFIAQNRNPLAATINCNPDFRTLQYKDVCMCPFNGYGPYVPIPPTPPPICIPTYDGGISTTNANIIFSGSSSISIPTLPILEGGIQPSNNTTEQIYDGGISTTSAGTVLTGSGSVTISNLPIVDGNIQEPICPTIYITQQIYDGGDVSTTNAPILSGS